METNEKYAVTGDSTVLKLLFEREKLLWISKIGENTLTLAISVSLTERVVSLGALPRLEFRLQLPFELKFEKRKNTLTLAISVSLTDRVVGLGALPLSFVFSCPWNPPLVRVCRKVE